MRRWITGLFVLTLGIAGVAVAGPPSAGAAPAPQKLHFAFGPLHVSAGQNMIQFASGNVPKPKVDGWIVAITPNLILPNGKVPAVDVLHLHHAVWINQSRKDSTTGGGERFFAVGEEKTKMELPSGYGYKYRASDRWVISYMIHDLVAQPYNVRITYDITFIPAKNNKKPPVSVIPIWMDVQNGSVYPVFDVHRGSGTGGRFTYPDPADNPYSGKRKNTYKLPTAGTFVATGGHLHPGGLWDDLYVDRAGKSALIFRSNAKYYEPAGPVSWDVTMGIAKADWKVHVKAGDTLRTTTTYDSTRSWYEGMGIMVAWFAPKSTKGLDPFKVKAANRVVRYTHGHLAENNNHGGKPDASLVDPSTLPDGPITSSITINYYQYSAGDLSNASSIPTVHQGQSIRFRNTDAPASGNGTWHTITDCALPCNRSTGVAYPLANGLSEFDSGQLGNAGPPTAGTLIWDTPTDLPPGTYAYWCRVHPFMRGAFRVVP